MPSSITVTVPAELVRELDTMARRENVTRDDLVCESLRSYLAARHFRQARRGFLNEAAHIQPRLLRVGRP